MSLFIRHNFSNQRVQRSQVVVGLAHVARSSQNPFVQLSLVLGIGFRVFPFGNGIDDHDNRFVQRIPLRISIAATLLAFNGFRLHGVEDAGAGDIDGVTVTAGSHPIVELGGVHCTVLVFRNQQMVQSAFGTFTPLQVRNQSGFVHQLELVLPYWKL